MNEDGKKLDLFHRYKSQLIRIGEQILSEELIPIDNISYGKFIERQNNFKQAKFIVSVCGQVKSGKSTLLNALIWGKDVLPSYHTAMTAKLTFIQFDEFPHIDVEFYSTQEWDEIVQSLETKDLEAYQELVKAVEFAQEEGYFRDEYISSTVKVEQIQEFELLKKYVGVPASGGVLTPFVKKVTIYDNIEMLRDIILVDSPGINDPNRINSRETEKWIDQSQAVLYVSYAGSALSEVDVDFIDQYLIGVPLRNRILVVNKVDTIQGHRQEIQEWLQGLQRNPEMKLRGIFDEEQSIEFVSSLGALLGRMLDSGMSIDEEYDFYVEKFEENGFLNMEQNGINTLWTTIEEKLLQNKGENLILSEQRYLESILDRHLRKIEKEIDQEQLNIDLSGKSLNELQEKKKQIQLERKKISILFEHENDNFLSFTEQSSTDLREEVDNILSSVIKNIEREINALISIKRSDSDAAWIINQQMGRKRKELFQTFGQYQNSWSQFFDERWQSLSMELPGISGEYFLKHVRVPTQDILWDIEELIEQELGQENISQAIDSVKGFLAKFIETEGALSKVRSELLKLVRNNVPNYYKSGSAKVIGRTAERVHKMNEDVEKEIQEILQSKDEAVDLIIESLDEKQNSIKDLESHLEKLKLRRCLLEKYKTDLWIQEDK